MADFLASFKFGSQETSSTRQTQCASVEELQTRVRELVAAKKSDTRAEHVSATLELGENAQFVASPSENESTNAPPPAPLSARDALTSQPSDDPVNHREIADQIMLAVTVDDDRVWEFEEQKLTPEGWTLKYVCCGSMMKWQTEHAKDSAVAGDCDKTQPNTKLLDRPAFDCRGSLSVSFLRKEKFISVELHHTPLHKTVEELFNIYKPPPRLTLPPGTGTPKTKQQPKARNAGGRPKSKTQRRRSGKAKTAEAQLVLVDKDGASAEADLDPELQDAMQQVALAAGSGQTKSPAQNGTAANANVRAGAPSVLSLNLSAEESARRKEAANEKLANAGVDLATLSTDQFNIFANQSPELQKESLAMLAKYGAERLRIVHPNREQSSAPPTGQTMASDEVVVEQSSARSKLRRKLGLSRLSCLRCKGQKVKCPKERPSCAQCVSSGATCEYPPQKPRIRNPKRSIVEGENEADANGEDEDTMDMDNTQVTETQETEAEELPIESTQYSYPQLDEEPQLQVLNPDIQQLPYFQSGPGMSWQQQPGGVYTPPYQPPSRRAAPSPPRQQSKTLSDAWSQRPRPSPLERHRQLHQQLEQQRQQPQERGHLQHSQHGQQYPPSTVAPEALQSRQYSPNSSAKLHRGTGPTSFQQTPRATPQVALPAQHSQTQQSHGWNAANRQANYAQPPGWNISGARSPPNAPDGRPAYTPYHGRPPGLGPGPDPPYPHGRTAEDNNSRTGLGRGHSWGQ